MGAERRDGLCFSEVVLTGKRHGRKEETFQHSLDPIYRINHPQKDFLEMGHIFLPFFSNDESIKKDVHLVLKEYKALSLGPL